MNYGKIIKKLRKERGMSQKELSQGISGCSTLSDFENKNTKISFDIMIQYLGRMNIRLDEFLLLHADQTHLFVQKRQESEHLVATTRQSVEVIKEEIERYQKRYEETEDIFYYLLAVNLKIFLITEKSATKAELKTEITFLENYINKIETFGRFEIVMLSNCLMVFSEEFLVMLHPKIVRYLEYLATDVLFKEDIFTYANNLTIVSLRENNTFLLREGLSLLDKIAQADEKNIYERLIYHFFKEVAKERQMGEINGEVISSLERMRAVGMYRGADECLDLYQDISPYYC